LLQGFLAQLDLILQHLQIVLQQRIGVILLHFLEQHAHGRQRCAQFMRRTGGLGRNGEQLLIAQAFFAANRAQFFLPAQLFSHTRGEERDDRSSQGKAQPHAVDLQILTGDRQGFQRIETRQHQRVQRQRDTGQNHRITPRQGHRRDGQRHQIIGNERVGRTAGEIQQRTVNHQIASQLQRVFKLGHRPRRAQAHGGEHAEQNRTAQGHRQLHPRQWQQLQPVGQAHGPGLCSEHQGANESQPPEVLASGGSQLYGGEHELS